MNVTQIKTLIEKTLASKPSDRSVVKLPELIPQASANEAAIVQLSTGSFTLAKLETHIRDDARGEGYKSRDGYTYTHKRESEALSTLADDDVQGFTQATSFLSGQTSYGLRVRAVEGIRRAALTSTSLRKLGEQLANLKRGPL